MKILVLEDDKKLAGLVRKGLETRGFAVDFCDNGDDAYALASTRSYDALVLDIMVPGRDGLSILRNLRERRITVPVVMITARNALNERLEGLNRKRIVQRVPTETLVRIGHAHSEIADTAKALAADLIVLGTHGYTGLKHALLGSTAERVLRHAPCPVVTVRQPGAGAE